MSRPAVIVVAMVVVVAVGAALWFGTDLVRDRGAVLGETPGQEAAAGAGRTTVTGQTVSGSPPQGIATISGNQVRDQSAGLTSSNTPAAETMDTTLVLAGRDVLVSYPEGFGLATTPEQVLVSSQIPPCDEGFDYCIYLNSQEFQGTNFSSAGVRIQHREDLSNEADCVLAQPSGYVDLVPVIAGASDFATTMYQDVSQGAAGHFSDGSLGRLYFESACYEFESRVSQAQFSNFPVGTVQEFDADALGATAGRLMSLLDGVTLPDGRSSLWARKVPSEPLEPAPDAEPGAVTSVENAPPGMPTVSEPVAGAHVGSPLLVVGEAPGTWFFEASFGYQLVVADGTVLASGAVAAMGDWMTEGPVPFEANVEFEVAGETNAVLILSKDNPSGLPENDASYEVPLLLLP